MRIQLSVLAASVVLLSVAAPGRAEKSRAWQTGTVLESGSRRVTETVGSRTQGQVDPYGNINATTSADRRMSDVDQFTIDAGDRLVWISQADPRMGGPTISFRLGKGLGLVPGQSVTFAIDRNTAYVLVDGKEHKVHVDRIALKPAEPAKP